MELKVVHRLRVLGGLVAIALMLVACGSSTPSSSSSSGGGVLAANASFKLGVSLTFNNTDFWTNYISYETKFATQYNATLIGPLVANNNAAQQITDIHTLVQEGAQALIINPVDSAAIAPALAFAASKNIPVISVDVAPSTGKVFMTVRADNVAYGKNSCEYIAQHATSTTGHVAVLEGDLASLNGQDRSNGCIQYLKTNYPNLKPVEYATKWDTPTAVSDAKTALSTYSDLRGIYVQWSAPEDGILAAEQALHDEQAPVQDVPLRDLHQRAAERRFVEDARVDEDAIKRLDHAARAHLRGGAVVEVDGVGDAALQREDRGPREPLIEHVDQEVDEGRLRQHALGGRRRLGLVVGERARRLLNGRRVCRGLFFSELRRRFGLGEEPGLILPRHGAGRGGSLGVLVLNHVRERLRVRRGLGLGVRLVLGRGVGGRCRSLAHLEAIVVVRSRVPARLLRRGRRHL